MNSGDEFIIREPEEKPIGYPPNPIIRQALEKTYISIVGALDIGDFQTFLKESADLTYDEAKDKMIREYGTPKELSEARMRAKSAQAAAEMEQAERDALEEQRTLEQEFAELDEIARKRLAENFELSRRNEQLEAEVKRLKEELAKVKAPPAPVAVPAPPGVPVPAAPPAHGSMYEEYRRRIGEAVTMADYDELASEIFDIVEREEYEKLTKNDITELMTLLRETAMRRSAQLAEMKLKEIPPTKPKERRPPKERIPEEVRIKVEAPAFFGVLPPGVMHRYSRPDIETVVFRDIPFIRDYELERTIIRNNLLLFPPQWYMLPPEEKRERYGWDLASAFKHAVEYLHKFSWDDLVKDYGIPKDYIEAWRKPPTE